MNPRLLLESRGLSIDTPGGRTLISDLELAMERERVAIVGRNGVGKSSLLRVLAGVDAPSSGWFRVHGRVEWVAQELGVRDAHASSNRARPEWPTPEASRGELASPERSSPGEIRRERLERAFDLSPDLLLLDEPTHDLDAEAVAWLADRVASWAGGLLVVSHDRGLLRCFDHFIVIAETGCSLFRGDLEQLQASLEAEDHAGRRDYERGLRRLMAAERRNQRILRRRAQKRNLGRLHELRRCTSRMKLNAKRGYAQESQGKRRLLQEDRIAARRELARSPRERLRASLRLEADLGSATADELQPPTQHAVEFAERDGPAGAAPPPRPRSVLCLEQVRVERGGRVLVDQLSLEMGRERLAVCGPNGSGKSTLLEVMVGWRRPQAGRVVAQPERIGYIAQRARNFELCWSLIEELEHCGTGSDPAGIEALLHRHRFPVGLARRPMCSLSPGERIRAALLCLARRSPRPELLVLDEPSAQLDFVGLASIESVLAAWPAGLIVASHDEALLRAIGIERRIVMG